MPLAFFVLTQYRRVTDGRTDRRTDGHVAITITRASIASRGLKGRPAHLWTLFMRNRGSHNSAASDSVHPCVLLAIILQSYLQPVYYAALLNRPH